MITLNEPTEPHQESLGFRETPQIEDDQLVLDYADYGKLRLQLFDKRTYDAVLPELLPLIDLKKDYQYLYEFVSAVLDAQAGKQKKLLGFIDNREKASQYSSILRDEFVSRFFEEFLKFHYHAQQARALDVATTLIYLQQQIPDEDLCSPLEKDVFKEINLWYARYVSMSPRMFEDKKGLLRLKSPDGLDDCERELLEIFLEERAIDKTFITIGKSVLITFQKYHATVKKCLCFSEEQPRDNNPLYHCIVLSADSNAIYREFVERYTLEKVKTSVATLHAKGYLCQEQIAENEVLYYLRPEHICFQLPDTNFQAYQEIKDRFLLMAALHSSEVKSLQRQQTEERFQKNDIHFLMATPTLEMGIDIGKLQHVLMVGVPPMPSNYAQRAGRAGRSAETKDALIMTFCAEDKNHDVYYFNCPKEMIEGVISPPRFNPQNMEVAKKHLHAYLLAESTSNVEAIHDFLKNFDQEVQQKLSQAEKIFGDISGFCVRDYINCEFRERLIEAVGKISNNPQFSLYKQGFFPDYSFRKDFIFVLDEEEIKAKRTAGLIKETDSPADFSLSDRDIELAYYKFSPGETAYMAGNVYTILAEGERGRNYTEQISDNSLPVRNYTYFFAKKERLFAAKSKIYNKYERVQQFSGSVSASVNKREVLQLRYYSEMTLFFQNEGCRKRDNTTGDVNVVGFHDKNGNFILGYDLKREALLLEFDRNICQDEKLVISLVSALDRTMKDAYGLDESEIQILQDVKPVKSADPQNNAASKTSLYAVFYDYDGNGNVPLDTMFAQFDHILEQAYKKMTSCVCKNGCYTCMKSYNTHYYAHNISKETAQMFIGYLLGKNRFVPSIKESEEDVREYDLVLTVKLKDHTFSVVAQAKGKVEPFQIEVPEDRKHQNATIFELMIQVIQAEFSEGMTTLLIRLNELSIVNAIKEGAVKKDKDMFAKLQFNLLRFRRIEAEQIRI